MERASFILIRRLRYTNTVSAFWFVEQAHSRKMLSNNYL